MKILFISHTAMGGAFVVGSHHLAREMARQGHDVVHVSSPITIAHIGFLRSKFNREKMRRCAIGGEVIDGVRDVVPFSILPWAIARRSGWLRRKLYSPFIYLRHVLGKRRLNEFDIVFLDEPRLFDLAESCGSRYRVYRPTDLYAEMREDPSIGQLEGEIARQGYKVVAMSRPIAKHMEAVGAPAIHLMQNGVEYSLFSAPAELPVEIELPAGLLAVYVGALDERFSIESVVKAAKSEPDVSFLIFGPWHSGIMELANDLPNIIFKGPVSYRHLPALLQRCDIALLPLSSHPSNAGRSPMKIFEYGAAGLQVISSFTPELAARNLPFVLLAEDSDDFASQVGLAICNLKKGRYSPEIGRAASATQAWSKKASQLIDLATSSGGI
ncbi:glycosyltransferase [Stenotrophomonas maltophilia]|uniref:glycosyltransferase n=1 Tax=Stenotrophomonas maltophilia TaxID=40324 RepID=UPI0015DE8C31|nr:glycosyltransferase [Stenotrophomonas maltophilia]ELN2584110.1 glycosyltransferase [Stenotrophomonas maltophilia]ELN2593344.1 glycosyltransferase [Stenotrophomonas maltophilia]MBA0296973.1 glycosyltransferase [Stenotrophomonas maltophilia]MBH1399924.1 glycosyltransferase [Stenotrophomonas maltophilia]MBH1702292.1 glycosyltransferase [Stenotrophomonas maltophilia]